MPLSSVLQRLSVSNAEEKSERGRGGLYRNRTSAMYATLSSFRFASCPFARVKASGEFGRRGGCVDDGRDILISNFRRRGGEGARWTR